MLVQFFLLVRVASFQEKFEKSTSSFPQLALVWLSSKLTIILKQFSMEWNIARTQQMKLILGYESYDALSRCV